MTPRNLILSLLLTTSALAQSADLRITSFTLSSSPAMTGERFALTLKWQNAGPDPATFVNVFVTGSPTPFYILSVATSGWPCYPSPDGSSFSCQNAQLAPGASAELVLQMITPPTPGPFTLNAEIRGAESDPNRTNNNASTSMTLAAAPSADLSIAPESQLYRAEASEEVTFPLQIRNAGSVEVRNVIAVITVPVASQVPPFSASGEGWSCGHIAYGPQAILCTRPVLNAGQSAPITVTATAPATDSTYVVNARVRGEGHSDPLTENDHVTATLQVGTGVTAQSWTRLLIPLTGGDVPGSGGSLWRTETTVLIDADEAIEIGGETDAHPLRRPFVTTTGFQGGSRGGEL
ncbi:MAG: hypothetical protein ACLGH0_04565, partial [Thermoanaerobaculia bacterium]